MPATHAIAAVVPVAWYLAQATKGSHVYFIILVTGTCPQQLQYSHVGESSLPQLDAFDIRFGCSTMQRSLVCVS